MAKTVYEKEMYPYVHKILRTSFLRKDGWVINHHENRRTYITDFTVERKRLGRTERVIAEVKRDCRAKQAHINQVRGYASKMAGNGVVIMGRILVYPSGADVQIIPNDIEVIKLRNIYCGEVR